ADQQSHSQEHQQQRRAEAEGEHARQHCDQDESGPDEYGREHHLDHARILRIVGAATLQDTLCTATSASLTCVRMVRRHYATTAPDNPPMGLARSSSSPCQQQQLSLYFWFCITLEHASGWRYRRFRDHGGHLYRPGGG